MFSFKYIFLIPLLFLSFCSFSQFDESASAQEKRQHLYISDDSKKVAISEHKDWLRENIRHSKDVSFQLISDETDNIGTQHLKFQQYFEGIKVESGVFTIDAQKDIIVSGHGEYYSEIEYEQSNPIIPSEIAITRAKETFGDGILVWEEADLVESPEKVILLVGNDYFLCYKTDVFSKNPVARKYVFIDASSGFEVQNFERIHPDDVVGTAVTAYNGIRQIITDSVSSTQYILQETTRGLGIVTKAGGYNGTSNPTTVSDIIDSDNYWDNGSAQANVAFDAHFGSEASWDYFFYTYGRNSFDNSGAVIQSNVLVGANYAGAFWDGTSMTYGDGDGVTYDAFTCIDVVGHEVTHAIIQNTSNLIYSYESGALNESFSDIFGVVVDFYANPTTANFLVGDQIALTQPARRSLIDPNSLGDPDTYLGVNWWTAPGDAGGVHTNSGVQNHWFYLLASGGTGVNDNGDAYTVSGIGVDDAAAIAYRNMTIYLTPSSQFADARFYAIQAATDLYGSCSPEVIATINAWHAVGVGPPYSDFVMTDSICLDFGSFYQSTLTQKSVWVYNPSCETLQVSASLAANSDYSITNNSFTIQPFDSSLINVSLMSSVLGLNTDTIWLFANGTAVPLCLTGIILEAPVVSTDMTNVTLTLSDCEDSLEFPLTIYNLGGDLLIWSILNSSGQTVPNSGALGANDSMVVSSLFIKQNLSYGVNNESITILSNDVQTPQYVLPISLDIVDNQCADFAYDIPPSCYGFVNFNDVSTHSPMSWTWDFGDGYSSVVQNPSHDYSANSTYLVTLTAANSFQTETYSQNVTINYSLPSIVAPTNGSLNLPIYFFCSSTVGAASWTWYFGDGDSSTLENPPHTYTSNGMYTVQLSIVLPSGCELILYHNIVISNLGLAELNQDFEIFPNPNNGVIFIRNLSAKALENLKIYDLAGKLIKEFDFNGLPVHSDASIEFTNAESGIYFLQVRFSDQSIGAVKLIVESP